MSQNPRGRQPGFKMPEEHRLKIANSNILNALIEHVQGEREMSATQVSAGLGLLKKVMPDLQAVSLGGDEAAPDIGIRFSWISSSPTSRETSSSATTTVPKDGPAS